MSQGSVPDGGEPVELLSFPCRFQLKAMGRWAPDFEELVSTVVSRHLNGASILDIQARQSSGASYVSVSCTIEATSRTQLDAIYLDLNSENVVLITL